MRFTRGKMPAGFPCLLLGLLYQMFSITIGAFWYVYDLPGGGARARLIFVLLGYSIVQGVISLLVISM